MKTDDDFNELIYDYDTNGQSLNDRFPGAELQSRGSAPSRGDHTPYSSGASDSLFVGRRCKVPISLSQMAGSTSRKTQQTTTESTSISQRDNSSRAGRSTRSITSRLDSDYLRPGLLAYIETLKAQICKLTERLETEAQDQE